VDRKTMIKIWPNMAAAQIAMRYRLRGPSLTFCTACASSLDAIGAGADLIRAGRADVVIAGGTEGGYGRPDGSPDGDFVPAVFYSHAGYGLTGGTRDRLRASLPFDVDRSGIVVGEGCAMVVLESRAPAAAPGAAGAQAVVAALCALRDRKLPPTAGTSRVDPEARFEVVTAAPAAIRSGHVQVNAFGFGGQNASLVLGAG
jgi:3-oxoacyl-[acyl-carrier-protein] synthase II